MKHILMGIVFSLMLLAPDRAKGAATEYRLVPFTDDLKTAIASDRHWKACGDYFAKGLSTEGEIIHFIYEPAPGARRVFAFVQIAHVTVSFRTQSTPGVVLTGTYTTVFNLQMSADDYRAGLPCLAKGIGA